MTIKQMIAQAKTFRKKTIVMKKGRSNFVSGTSQSILGQGQVFCNMWWCGKVNVLFIPEGGIWLSHEHEVVNASELDAFKDTDDVWERVVKGMPHERFDRQYRSPKVQAK